MKQKLEMTAIPLGGLAGLFDQNDRTCVYLVDQTGNSFTFFKYKAKLIDVSSEVIAVAIKKKTKQEAIEDIRKGLLYGIKQGENTIFHIGESKADQVNALLTGAPFWQPKKLFQSPQKMDEEWYRSKLMKPTDKDIFGNVGTFYPNEKFRLYVSTSKDMEFGRSAG